MSRTLEELQNELSQNIEAHQELDDWKAHKDFSVVMADDPTTEIFLNRRREAHKKGEPFLFSSTLDNQTYFSTFPDFERAVAVEVDDWNTTEKPQEAPTSSQKDAEVERLKRELQEAQTQLQYYGALTPQQIDLENLIATQKISTDVDKALREKQLGNQQGYGELIAKHYTNIVAKDAAQKKFDEVNSGINFEEFCGDNSLKTRLAREGAGLGAPFRFEGLMKQGHITTITAVRKAGKSTFAINRLKSYADGNALFGKFPVNKPKGRVLYMNYELTDEDVDEWVAKLKIQNTDKIDIWNLRGKNFYIQYPSVQEFIIKYCLENDIEILEIDPLQSALKSGNTSDEAEANEFAAAVNYIKDKAGIKDVIITTHMGKSALNSDNNSRHSETSMGASKWEGWPDNLIIFKRIDDVTSEIRIDQGRGITLEPTRLVFDPATYLMSYNGTKSEVDDFERAKRQIEFLNALPVEEVKQNEFLKKFGNSEAQSKLKSFITNAAEPLGWVTVVAKARGEKFILQGPRWSEAKLTREDPREFAQFIVENTRSHESGQGGI